MSRLKPDTWLASATVLLLGVLPVFAAAYAAEAAPAQAAQPAETNDGAAGQASDTSADEVAVQLVNAFIAEVDTLQSDFFQVLYDADMQPVQESRGRLSIHRPGRFRWDYTEPFEQLIVADGERVWMFDADLEQVTVKTLDETLASTPAMLLSGSGDILDAYIVRGSFAAGGLTWVHLEPRAQDTDFRGVRLGFAGKELQAMELTDSLDQITRIVFEQMQRNPSLDDSVFRFEPPAGVDVIGDPRAASVQ